ncbi:alpha/beta hydrolase [Nocardia sp. NPDC050793]|uniref:alpha/beta hydrolase n=1 Tax=Nocardia sp. NPDC050793 TaxID=3155159 RepID=UPI00340E5D69
MSSSESEAVIGSARATPGPARIEELPPLPAEAVSVADRFVARIGRRLLHAPSWFRLCLSGRPQVRIDGHKLDPGIQLALRLLRLRGAATLVPDSRRGSPDVADTRARVRRTAAAFTLDKTEVGGVRDIEIAGAHGPLRARHYRPLPSSTSDTPPLLVFFHGGGYVLGDVNTHDEPCRMLCRYAEVQVLSVDYRLAPEHPFPAGVDDALAAFRWGVAHASALGADADRVAVGGDSAGATLSAAVAQITTRVGGPVPALQLLLYPSADLTEARTTSDELFAEGFYLTENDRQWCRGHYLSGAVNSDGTDPRTSPALAEDLSGLPPTILISAAFDPLRDEDEAYADALRAAGNRVVLQRMPGLIHGFLNMTVVPSARDAVLQITGMLRAGLAV